MLWLTWQQLNSINSKPFLLTLHSKTTQSFSILSLASHSLSHNLPGISLLTLTHNTHQLNSIREDRVTVGCQVLSTMQKTSIICSTTVSCNQTWREWETKRSKCCIQKSWRGKMGLMTKEKMRKVAMSKSKSLGNKSKTQSSLRASPWCLCKKTSLSRNPST